MGPTATQTRDVFDVVSSPVVPLGDWGGSLGKAVRRSKRWDDDAKRSPLDLFRSNKHSAPVLLPLLYFARPYP
jgi:hypothetical protein